MTRAVSRWVIASGNRGKVREIETLLGDSGIQVVTQGEFGIESAEETATTFVENAVLKARHAAFHTGLPAIADDSGLSVDALAGAPGIHSARYAGPSASDQTNVTKLLNALVDTPDEDRGAHFHCVIAVMFSATDPAPVIAHGEWRGRIAHARVGDCGFGYDPIFFIPDLDATAAQLSPELKNRVSHRGQALAKLTVALKKQRQDSSR